MEWKRHTHQQVHIINLLYEPGKEDSQPVNNLIKTNSHLSTLEDKEPIDQSHYQCLARKLLYLMQPLPDLARAGES